MAKLFNRVAHATATTGTGTITLGAAVTNYQTFAAAGVTDGDIVSYLIEDGSDWEYGHGTYTASGTTLARTTILGSSNSGSAIDLSGSAVVYCDVLAEDIGAPASGWIDAGGTWTYASADDPTYTFTLAAFDATTKYTPGMKIKLTQSTGGTKFAFITKVVFDDPGSTITAYFGTDYNLENEAITAPYYSILKAPLGFPLNPAKWTVEITDTTNRSQENPVDATWYNLGSLSITIPIGIWLVSYWATVQPSRAVSGICSGWATLSTANNTEGNKVWSSWIAYDSSSNNDVGVAFKQNILNLSVADVYYLNEKAGAGSLSTLYLRSDENTTIIRAVCAYL